MYANPLNAYQKTAKNTMSGRELEAHALTSAAMKLKEFQMNWDPDTESGYPELAGAVKHNQKLWSILQAELSTDDHPLPTALRERLLSVSLFVDKRSFDILAHPSPEKIKSLVDINLAIAAGLRGAPAMAA
ncbi:flagellar biosynthesis regulator FlaF [Desulfococcus sp.]|uniref:flagellar biosynthesis regulator FlaF n=1 Tax=Desulfococcus sp. TaxID=2025834 RepID=UPI0035934B8C